MTREPHPSGERVGESLVVDEPDLIGRIEVELTRDDGTVLVAILAEQVKH